MRVRVAQRIKKHGNRVLTGAGVFALEGKRSDWLSEYIESRYAEAVNMLASDTSAAANEENAGAP